MRRPATLFFLIVLFFTSSACGGKKPPEQTYWKSKHILTILREMNKAYEQKNLDDFLSHVSPAYHDRDGFTKSLTGVFKKFESIHFTIQYSKMVILLAETGQIRITFTWSAEWLTVGGTTVKDGGRVTCVFEPGDFKLLSIDGKNPYLAQPGETPGSK